MLQYIHNTLPNVLKSLQPIHNLIYRLHFCVVSGLIWTTYKMMYALVYSIAQKILTPKPHIKIDIVALHTVKKNRMVKNGSSGCQNFPVKNTVQI